MMTDDELTVSMVNSDANYKSYQKIFFAFFTQFIQIMDNRFQYNLQKHVN